MELYNYVVPYESGVYSVVNNTKALSAEDQSSRPTDIDDKTTILMESRVEKITVTVDEALMKHSEPGHFVGP